MCLFGIFYFLLWWNYRILKITVINSLHFDWVIRDVFMKLSKQVTAPSMIPKCDSGSLLQLSLSAAWSRDWSIRPQNPSSYIYWIDGLTLIWRHYVTFDIHYIMYSSREETIKSPTIHYLFSVFEWTFTCLTLDLRPIAFTKYRFWWRWNC